MNGGGANDGDPSACCFHLLNVSLVVVCLNLVHAGGREVAHIDGLVSIVDHGRRALVNGAQACGKVRLKLAVASGGVCALVVFTVTATAHSTSEKGSTK